MIGCWSTIIVCAPALAGGRSAESRVCVGGSPCSACWSPAAALEPGPRAAAHGSPPTLACPFVCVQDKEGRVVGATVKDGLTGRQHAVYARTVLNAAGPFSDEVRALSQVRWVGSGGGRRSIDVWAAGLGACCGGAGELCSTRPAHSPWRASVRAPLPPAGRPQDDHAVCGRARHAARLLLTRQWCAACSGLAGSARAAGCGCSLV